MSFIKGRDLINKFLETDHYAYYIKTTAYGESIRKNISKHKYQSFSYTQLGVK